ncbi:MAG: acetyl-CoA carboxylase biotin carboxyl carrier protein subunit [Pseudomonadota bacterium]
MTEKKSPVSVAGLEPDLVRELAAILRDTGLTEIEVERGDLRVRISGASAGVFVPHAPAAATPAPVSAAVAPPADLRAHPGAVTSPMVGTAYLSPKPEEPPYAKIGDLVSEGQTILVVEAMKTFNPIPAPRAGRLTQILIANEQPVEYGQPLAIIE